MSLGQPAGTGVIDIVKAGRAGRAVGRVFGVSVYAEDDQTKRTAMALTGNVPGPALVELAEGEFRILDKLENPFELPEE